MSATCPACSRPLAETARFCGACGAVRPAPAEDPAAVARYETVLRRFVGGAGIGARESQQLAALRQKLGVSLLTHQTLSEGIEAGPAIDAVPIVGLSLDTSTFEHFAVDTRCLVRLRVENTFELALERVVIRARLNGDTEADPSELTGVFPGDTAVASLWLQPRIGGFHELSGELTTVDLTGAESAYRFDGIAFRIASGSEPTRVSIVNIDQSSARVVDNSRSAFAAGESAGPLVEEGEWRAIPLTAIMQPRPAAAQHPTEAAQSDADALGPVDFTVVTESSRFHVSASVAFGDLSTIYEGSAVGGADPTPVIVKIADDPADNDLLHNEPRVLARLHGDPAKQAKHLPVVLDQFRTSDGRLGTVQEKLDGYNLYAIRERYPEGIPQRHIIWVLRRVLSVLGHAHSRGVIHGNVEPAHIMVRPSDHNVWLIDWCYAVVEPGRTGQGFRALNEVYSPPEVAQRKPPIPASDLYATSKSMVYLLGGDPDTLAMPEAVDERLQRLLRFMARESPLQRAQDAWEMYGQTDRVREAIFGPHTFVPFVI